MKRLLAGLVASVTAIATLSLVSRYRVEGRSMLRAYAPGDRLLVERLSYRLRSPRPGDAVVVRQPNSSGRLDLKRIAASPGARVTIRGEERALLPDEWFLLGDNLDESTDSRQLGPIWRSEIIGKVWLKY